MLYAYKMIARVTRVRDCKGYKSTGMQGLQDYRNARDTRLQKCKGYKSTGMQGLQEYRNARVTRVQGPDYQNACKVTMFSTLYLELQHESYNVPAML